MPFDAGWGAFPSLPCISQQPLPGPTTLPDLTLLLLPHLPSHLWNNQLLPCPQHCSIWGLPLGWLCPPWSICWPGLATGSPSHQQDLHLIKEMVLDIAPTFLATTVPTGAFQCHQPIHAGCSTSTSLWKMAVALQLGWYLHDGDLLQVPT